jgi:glycerol-3-phosphate acyltransferase PlsY
MIPLGVVVIAYFLGAIPFGYLVVKWKTGGDVRKTGSGNIGATNVLRTSGRAAAAATLVLDILKGYFAVWLAGRLTDANPFWMSAAALAVMAGHAFPVFLGFRGGKAVASFLGAFLRLTPLPLLAIVIVFLGVVAWTRYISMGSVVAAITFPLAVWIIGRPPISIFIASLLASALIVYRHISNIQRLHEGTEHVLDLGARRR